VEWDDNAIEVFRMNFPGVPIYHGDIADLTGKECMKLAGIRKGELDVLDGSPPCQGFSTAGRRKWDDPRNSLFKEYARLLKELQPKVFVMENVTGMVKGCMKQAYLTIIKTLRECGYKAKGEILNAVYYNVPQTRQRVIIIGVRKDLNIEPSHPKPKAKPLTIMNVFKNVPDGLGLQLSSKTDRLNTSKTVAMVKRMKQGESVFGVTKKYGFDTSRLHIARPAPTLKKSLGSFALGFVHPTEDRRITIPEAKRIMSFPDDFTFIGTYQEQWARIGNSVPPNLMMAIAGHIKNEILKKSEK